MNATRAKAINETHKRFEIGVFSPSLGKFVPRFKNAVHATIEGALKVVGTFKACKWEIQGLHKKHETWHPVATGTPETV